MGLLSLLSGGRFFEPSEVMPGYTNDNARLNNIEDALSDKYLGTTYGQQALMDKQYQMNKDLQQAERDWQEKMMSRMNEYNSPANQMKLLAAAGLNPALMYGQMSDIGSQNPPASGAASVGLASPQYGAVDPYIAATIENIQADTQKKKGETKSQEIKNTLDGMNLQAFTTFFEQNENDIVRKMQEELGIFHNEFVQSNYDLFAASWDFSIQYGLTLEDAIKSGTLYAPTADDWSEFYSDNMQDMYNKAKSHFIGGRDAEIAVFAANKVMADASKLKNKKDFDIWSYLINLSKNGNRWQQMGAQAALAALFISGEKFSIPLPAFSFKHNYYHANKKKD